eukprot:m.11788 g.11788  ORF g.11788 m.11788 type:complete len:473 (-) comp5865_c0_seq1:115-1533(-)
MEQNEQSALRQLNGQNPMPVSVVLTPEEVALERTRIRALFDRIDTDKNGILYASELQQELKRLNLPFAPQHIRDIFLAADRDQDGHVNFEEFFNYCMEKERLLRTVFVAMDQYRDNKLTHEEIRGAFERLGFKVSDKELRKLIKRIGKHDQIGWSEWREFMMLFPSNHVRDMFRFWRDAAMVLEDDVMVHDEGLAGHWWRQLLAGGAAGAVSRTCTAPLDRLKIMLQVQTASPRGMFGTLEAMVREGGPSSLWRGNGINVLKIAPESAIKFLAWEQAKWLLYGSDHDDGAVSVGQRLAAGSIAGVVSQVTIFPFEVLKTRMATARTGQYRSVWHCAQTVHASQGLLAFYRGLFPSLLGVIPYAGIDLAVYETLKEMYVENNPGTEPTVVALMACGATSSSVGQLASYPLALVRTRMQAGESKRTMLGEFEAVIRDGGLRGLYRGLVPNFLKVAPAVSISYVIYERMKSLLSI